MIDSLPYVDIQYNNPKTKAKVNAMIEAELTRGDKRPSDYLAEIDAKYPTPTFDQCVHLLHTLDSLERGEKPEQIDFSARYHVNFPREDATSPEDIMRWKEILNTLRASAEIESSHVMELELLKQKGSAAWLKTLERVEMQKAYLENELKEVQESINSISRRRKQEQLGLVADMSGLEAAYTELVQQNHALAYERLRLMRQIKRIKQ